MASDYGFMKPDDPAFPNFGEDGGVIDIDTSKLTYQMVPIGGRRLADVTSPTGQACQVTIEAPQVVEFGPRTFTSNKATVVGPVTMDRFSQALPAGLSMKFEILPLSVGHTDIVLKAPGGATLASLRVSVKPELKVTVSACRLVDLEFKNPFDDAAIRAAMAQTKITYRNTANVVLIDNPTIYPVECDIGLGNPINLGRAFNEYNQESSTVFRHILEKIPATAKAAQFVTIFGWDFEITHLPLVGLNVGKFCFVEFQPKPLDRTLTLEHEIGHAMGLGHGKEKSIMNGDGDSRIERFEANEIENLNKPMSKKP